MQDKSSATGLNRLLTILAENEIDFIIIGGFAGVLYGSTMVTRDLDICSLLTPSDIERLRTVLSPYHPKHRMTPQKLSFLTEPRSLEKINNLYLETDFGVLDILSSVKGLPYSFETLKGKATPFELFGNTVRVLAIADLIEAKKKMGRPKDLLAAEELARIDKLKSR